MFFHNWENVLPNFTTLNKHYIGGIPVSYTHLDVYKRQVGDILAKSVDQRLRLKGDQNIRHGRVVLGHADVSEREKAFFTLKSGELRIYERAGNFTGTVWAEIEEDDRIVRLNAPSFGAVSYTHLLCCAHRRKRYCRAQGIRQGQEIVSWRNPH